MKLMRSFGLDKQRREEGRGREEEEGSEGVREGSERMRMQESEKLQLYPHFE